MDPFTIGALLSGAGMSLGSIITQMQSARNNHLLIKSNQELGRKAGLNQLILAEMQIKNLQEIDQKKRETLTRINDRRIQADFELEEIKAGREFIIEKLKVASQFLLQQLDHSQRQELEKFRSQERFSSIQWRTTKEREYRMETAELVNKIREKVAQDNRAHVEKMVGYKMLYKKSWPLKNPALVYLNLPHSKLLVFLSAPVITIKESQKMKFPQNEAYLLRKIHEFVLPDYAAYIDVDGGSWVSKDYWGESALKPLVTELTSKAFVVLESSLAGFSKRKNLLNLSVAYKDLGQDTCSFVPVITDYDYLKAFSEGDNHLEKDWENTFKVWAFLHSFYISIYADIHFFQFGDYQKLNFLSVLKRLLTSAEFRPLFFDDKNKLRIPVLHFIRNAVEHVLSVLGDICYLNENNYLLLISMAEELLNLHPQLEDLSSSALSLSFYHWSLSKVIDVNMFFNPQEKELLTSKLDDQDLVYLRRYQIISKSLPVNKELALQIDELLLMINSAQIISL